MSDTPKLEEAADGGLRLTACSPSSDRDYVTDVCITLRCELDEMQRERDDAAKLVRRLLRSHGEKSSRRSVCARSDAGLWLARYDSENASSDGAAGRGPNSP
jgi:hypothetical protein